MNIENGKFVLTCSPPLLGPPLKGEAKPSRRSYGETSAYLEARLRRDPPEILAAKERGMHAGSCG
jgi:hypothetical protein